MLLRNEKRGETNKKEEAVLHKQQDDANAVVAKNANKQLED
jgi:hypothetical protein